LKNENDLKKNAFDFSQVHGYGVEEEQQQLAQRHDRQTPS